MFAGSEHLWTGTKCDACQAADAAREKAEARQADLATRRASAGIPRAYHGRTLHDLRTWPGEVILACHAWASNGGGLYLSGPVGVGKTTAAAAAAWERMAREPIQWVRAAQLVRWSMASFGSPEHEQAQAIASGSAGLVLDDLGAEPPSDQGALLLFDTIQARMDAAAPLLITSNFKIAELCARTEGFGQRLASRLRDYCHWVHVEGEDHRRRARPPLTTEIHVHDEPDVPHRPR